MARERIDRLLVKRGVVASRARAQALIAAGKVLADGRVIARASDLIDDSAGLEVSQDEHEWVSRGGQKLAGALDDLAVDPRGWVVADIGASTGGFTDCVLARGALRVHAVDVGHDQLHPKLRTDPRVISREGLNARTLTRGSLGEDVDLVVVDASFISLTKLLPALNALLKPEGWLLALVKPQFEVGPAGIGKRGVVKDDEARASALAGVIAAASELGLSHLSSCDSRLPGPEGNREIFALFRAQPNPEPKPKPK